MGDGNNSRHFRSWSPHLKRSCDEMGSQKLAASREMGHQPWIYILLRARSDGTAKVRLIASNLLSISPGPTYVACGATTITTHTIHRRTHSPHGDWCVNVVMLVIASLASVTTTDTTTFHKENSNFSLYKKSRTDGVLLSSQRLASVSATLTLAKESCVQKQTV